MVNRGLSQVRAPIGEPDAARGQSPRPGGNGDGVPGFLRLVESFSVVSDSQRRLAPFLKVGHPPDDNCFMAHSDQQGPKPVPD